MAWTYLAESADSPLHWRLGSGQSPTVKSTDTLAACCFHACEMDRCLLRRSGMMCGALGQSISDERALTLSTAASPARILALRVLERAWLGSEADYSLRSRDSLAKYDRASSSWKTCLPFGPVGPTLSSDDWPSSGMTAAGECFPLSMWERRTSGSDGGYWPTATATDSKSSRNATVKDRKVEGHASVTLTDFVTLFPTPSASSYGTNLGGGAGRVGTAGPSLETTPVADDAVNRTKGKWNSRGEPKLSAAVMLWPTPRASDGEKGGPNQRGSKGDLALPAAVMQWATPTSRDWKSGKASEATMEKNARPLSEQVGGSLSADWVEWLMAYPSGWTVLEPWAMQWFRPARGKRSKGSRASSPAGGTESA
jgi:hypothetical protein